MRFVKKEYSESRYTVQETAQAIGLSEGVVSGYFSNRGITTRDGLTLDQIAEVLERQRTRGGGIDFKRVVEIRNRLMAEKGYELDKSDETSADTCVSMPE